MASAKRHREVVVSTEDFDLDRRLESIKATAIKFVQDMDETIIVDGGMPVRRTSRVWSDEDDEDRWRSNLIGRELHRLFNDLMDAVVRKRGNMKTKKERLEIRLICGQMRTALRFEKYTGWDFEYDPGGEISAADAMRILQDGFDALARWIDWSRPVPGEKLFKLDV